MMKQQPLKRYTLLVISVIGIIAIAMLVNQLSKQHAAVHQFISQTNGFWISMHIAIILGFFWLYPPLIRRYARQHQWTTEHMAVVIRYRWRYVMWLVIIELVLQLL